MKQHRRKGRLRTYDRIKIRSHSVYWKSNYSVQPPMEYDSHFNLLTIYGTGVKAMKFKGLDIEEHVEVILNHEILHDVINNLVDPFSLNIWQRHWPFFMGIDYMKGEWFTTMMNKMGYDTPRSAVAIAKKLDLLVDD